MIRSVVFEGQVTRVVYDDTHQWLLGSCVKLVRLRPWCCKNSCRI